MLLQSNNNLQCAAEFLVDKLIAQSLLRSIKSLGHCYSLIHFLSTEKEYRYSMSFFAGESVNGDHRASLADSYYPKRQQSASTNPLFNFFAGTESRATITTYVIVLVSVLRQCVA